MNDSEKIKNEALLWLKSWTYVSSVEQYARAIEAMLAKPRLPTSLSGDDMLGLNEQLKGEHVPCWSREDIEQMLRALCAHFAKPKTKTVWRVTIAEGGGAKWGCTADSLDAAYERAGRYLKHDGATSVTIEKAEVSA